MENKEIWTIDDIIEDYKIIGGISSRSKIDFLEVVPQYKYTSQPILQVRVRQDLIYTDQTALVIKAILEDRDLDELKKEFPMIQF